MLPTCPVCAGAWVHDRGFLGPVPDQSVHSFMMATTAHEHPQRQPSGFTFTPATPSPTSPCTCTRAPGHAPCRCIDIRRQLDSWAAAAVGIPACRWGWGMGFACDDTVHVHGRSLFQGGDVSSRGTTAADARTCWVYVGGGEGGGGFVWSAAGPVAGHQQGSACLGAEQAFVGGGGGSVWATVGEGACGNMYSASADT